MFPLHGQDPFYRIVRYTLASILRFKSSLILGLSKSFTSHHPHRPSPLPTLLCLPTYAYTAPATPIARRASQASVSGAASQRRDPRRPTSSRKARSLALSCLSRLPCSNVDFVVRRRGERFDQWFVFGRPQQVGSPLCESFLAHPQATSVRMYSTVLTWMLVRLQQYRSELYAIAPLRLS